MPTPTQPLLAAVYRIQTLCAGLPGINSAPQDPTETVNAYPAVVSFPAHIVSVELFSNTVKTLAVIRTLIMNNRTSLPQDVAKMVPYGQLFLMAMQGDITLNNTVMTITATSGQFGEIAYGGTTAQFIGWTFDQTVKIEDPLS